jgi:hypothetical protein
MIPEQHRGYEPSESTLVILQPRVEICQECNEPIIDGNPKCHKIGCRSNMDVEF